VPPTDDLVVDASVLVDLVIKGESWEACRDALSGRRLHAPAHLDVEVVSALARLQRASAITAPVARRALTTFAQAPVQRHDVAGLVADAWKRSARLRVADAFYVALAADLGTSVMTIDRRLARASSYAVLPPGLSD
jgi:predicted nucleic acid-binding protein